MQHVVPVARLFIQKCTNPPPPCCEHNARVRTPTDTFALQEFSPDDNRPKAAILPQAVDFMQSDPHLIAPRPTTEHHTPKAMPHRHFWQVLLGTTYRCCCCCCCCCCCHFVLLLILLCLLWLLCWLPLFVFYFCCFVLFVVVFAAAAAAAAVRCGGGGGGGGCLGRKVAAPDMH